MRYLQSFGMSIGANSSEIRHRSLQYSHSSNLNYNERLDENVGTKVDLVNNSLKFTLHIHHEGLYELVEHRREQFSSGRNYCLPTFSYTVGMFTKLVAPFHVNAPSIGHSQSVMYNHV